MTNILFKYPSRSRPHQFLEGVENIIDKLVNKENYHIACTIDEDDPDMCNEWMEFKLSHFPNTSIQYGLSQSKIHAVNRDLPDFGDIIVVMSDDMRFIETGFDEFIRQDFEKFFPDGDGVLCYPDGYAPDTLCTMSILGRKYYNRFGYLYHSAYYSLWCDNEFSEVARSLGRFQYIPTQLFEHRHYAPGKASKDALYRRNDTYHKDRLIYEQRKASNFQ